MLGAALKANHQAKKWLRRTKSTQEGLVSRQEPKEDEEDSSSSVYTESEEEDPAPASDGYDMASLQRMLTMNEEGLKAGSPPPAQSNIGASPPSPSPSCSARCLAGGTKGPEPPGQSGCAWHFPQSAQRILPAVASWV